MRPDIIHWLAALPEVQEWMRKEGITYFGQKRKANPTSPENPERQAADKPVPTST